VSVPRGSSGDPWVELRRLTPARIALGRAGGSLPTAELLRFSAAHAAARDAVWAELDLDRLERELAPCQRPLVRVASEAPDRRTYLVRPDLGRRLPASSRERLETLGRQGPYDVALILADGLSAAAAQRQAPALVAALLPRLAQAGCTVGPIALARQARVALQDPIGAALGSRCAVILLGERPGLGAADSLGAYLVFGPGPGRTDADRNCVSNIRPGGLPITAAAELLAWLIGEALRRSLSGVELKDERAALAGAPPAGTLPGGW
jgi:ethanolamine ammonia-lyase small subunit